MGFTYTKLARNSPLQASRSAFSYGCSTLSMAVLSRCSVLSQAAQMLSTGIEPRLLIHVCSEALSLIGYPEASTVDRTTDSCAICYSSTSRHLFINKTQRSKKQEARRQVLKLCQFLLIGQQDKYGQSHPLHHAPLLNYTRRRLAICKLFTCGRPTGSSKHSSESSTNVSHGA